MIVTCPNCTSKYRVRDEKVPEGGAQLRCPECDQLFIAKPPKKDDVDMARAMEEMRAEREASASRLADLERMVEGMREEIERKKSEIVQLSEEKNDLLREIQNAQSRVALAEEGLQKARQDASDAQAGAQNLEAEAREAKGLAARLQQDLQHAQEALAQQKPAGGAALSSVELDRMNELERENQRLKANGGAMSPEVKGALGAIAPMTWGLDQAIKYMEPYAPNQAELMNHLKQLKLLHTLLGRLTSAAEN